MVYAFSMNTAKVVKLPDQEIAPMDDIQHPEAGIVRGACPHDCPDTCAWQATVKNGVAVRLVGDPDHPFTRGGLCAKVNHYLERVYSPDRILFPLRRVGPKGAGTLGPPLVMVPDLSDAQPTRYCPTW